MSDSDDIEVSDAEAIVISIIAEMVWPDRARHAAPAEILQDWVQSFPDAERSKALFAIVAVSLATISRLTKILLGGKMMVAQSEETKMWASTYLKRLNDRSLMNRAVDKED